MSQRHCRAAFLICALFLTTALAEAGPLPPGVVTGRVVDRRGAPVAGAAVAVIGTPLAAATRTGADGRFVLRDVPAGRYLFKVDGAGMLMLLETVTVAAGETLRLDARATAMLAPVVVASAPLVQTTSTTTGATFSRQELENLPQSRSFTDLIHLTPRVSTDQVDIGGSEAGNTATILRNGGSREQNTFRLDGVNISDMSNPGATPPFFVGLDSIAEIRVLTGGVGRGDFGQSSGVTTNVITRSSSNRMRGSASVYYTGGPLVSDFNETNFDQRGGTELSGAQDYNFNLAGPLSKGKLWFYTGYNRQDITRDTRSGGVVVDNGFGVNDFLFKANYRIGPTDRLNASMILSPYTLHGFGAADNRGAGSVWDKSGTSSLFKFEERHTFKSGLTLGGWYARVGLNYTLTPVGGTDAVTTIDQFGLYQNSYYLQDTNRHSNEFNIDGAYSLKVAGMGHDFRFGYNNRMFDDDTFRSFPGSQLVVRNGATTTALLPPDINYAVGTSNWSFHLQDTIRATWFTTTLGVEYKHQTGQPYESTVVPNAIHPSVVPGATYPGADASLNWSNFEPHLGFALPFGKKNTLRFSYAKFTDDLTIPLAGVLDPLTGPLGHGGEQFNFTSLDGSGRYKEGDPKGPSSINGGIPTNDPRFLMTPSIVEEGVEAPVTREFHVNYRHKFGFGDLTLDYDKRHVRDILTFSDLVNNKQLATTSSYVLAPPINTTDLDGNPITLRPYVLNPSYQFTGGVAVSNLLWQRERDDWDLVFGYHHKSRDCGYLDGWFGYGRSHWLVPETFFRDANNVVGPADDDGAAVAEQSTASNRLAVFPGSQWSYEVTAYTPKLKFIDLSGRVWGRQGFPAPLFGMVTGSDQKTRDIQIGDFDEDRYPSLHILDLRVSKTFDLCRKSKLEVMGDILNLTNSHTVLQQNLDVLSPQKGLVTQRLNPRVIRLGVKYTF